MQLPRRETLVGSSTLEYSSPAPSTSTMKYECEYCGKGFTRPSSLKVRHIEVLCYRFTGLAFFHRSISTAIQEKNVSICMFRLRFSVFLTVML